jgi:hypothetical protein
LEDIAEGTLPAVQVAEIHDIDINDLAYYIDTYSVEIDHIRHGTEDRYWREQIAQRRAEHIENTGRPAQALAARPTKASA